MTQIYDENYTHTPAEIDEMRSFLIKSAAVSLTPFNWRLAMFENWIYGSRYLEPPEYFIERVHLWRYESGELVAFTIRGTNFVHLQIDRDHRFLEAEMLAWAEQNWLNDEGQINLLVYEWDFQRQKLLAGRGYQNLGEIEDIRIYDLNREIARAILPPGFRFQTAQALSDFRERIELTNRVWGMSLDERWLRGKSSAPSYSHEWDILVVSPEGRLAAYNLVWLYPDIQTAEIDPLGTHPDFRRLGLARALVLESFRRMQEKGIRHAYIGSDAEDPVVSHLYDSFQPVELYQGHHWRKP